MQKTERQKKIPMKSSGNESHDQHLQKSLQIKQDDKFFSRLLSKENSSANTSSRVYYRGVPSAIPFTWESQPGTPKHVLYSDPKNIPPLTPPPSYFSKLNSKPMHAKPSMWKSIFQAKFILSNKKNHVTPTSSLPSVSSSSSLSWSSSSFSSPSVNMMNPRKRRSFSWSTSPLRLHGLDDEEESGTKGRKNPVLCFGIKGKSLSNRLGCCYKL